MIKILQWNKTRCLCYVYTKDTNGNYQDFTLTLIDTDYLMNLEASDLVRVIDYPLKRGDNL